jgi:hypothetical protein
VRRLVDCPYFVLDEVRPTADWAVGGNGRCHFLAVLAGHISCESSWQLPALGPGACLLMPAALGRQSLRVSAADDGECRLLRVCLPS